LWTTGIFGERVAPRVTPGAQRKQPITCHGKSARTVIPDLKNRLENFILQVPFPRAIRQQSRGRVKSGWLSRAVPLVVKDWGAFGW